jgi:hypothetical protein
MTAPHCPAPQNRRSMTKTGGGAMVYSIRLLRLSCAVLLAASFWVSTAHAQKWGRAAAFPEASEELYGIAANGKLYAFGGLAPGWTPKGLMFEYDPGGDSWGTVANAPDPIRRSGGPCVSPRARNDGQAKSAARIPWDRTPPAGQKERGFAAPA